MVLKGFENGNFYSRRSLMIFRPSNDAEVI